MLRTCPACHHLISEADALCPCCGAPLTAQNPTPSAQALSCDADSTLVVNRRMPASADGDSTLAGAPGHGNLSSAGFRVGEGFMGYVFEERIASSGMEADIFRVRRGEGQYVLKLYHYNAAPKKEILDKMLDISEQFPKCVVRIYECGQDPASGQWYEIQEYVRHGSLKGLMPGLSQSLSVNPEATALVDLIVREIAEALAVLHAKGVMHCDLKPANILVRTLEPLDLVLTDFGISSMLDPEASSRATSVKGSPMYQAPEAFTGHVTHSMDWWALGCILCETLLGRHPFSGLNPNEIMLKLIQKGIDLTGLDFSSPPLRKFELLLKGLLTLDYQKRWGGEEVHRWLDGERTIPVYSLSTQQTEKLTPYPAGESVYYEIRELLASFTKNEKAWKRGRDSLYRGELEIWLASNRQEEDRKRVAEVKNRYIDQKDLQDAGLCELIYAYNQQLPFCFYGIKINATNLCLLCGKQMKKEPLTQAEAGVVNAISNGTLLRLCQQHLNIAKMRIDRLEAVFDLLKNAGTPERQWVCLQAVFMAPGEYYWPPFAGDLIKSQPRNRLNFLRQRRIPWACLLTELQTRVMTPELAIKMQNPLSYDEFLTEMEQLLPQANTGQTNDAQPMAFSNCDGSQFVVQIVKNRPSRNAGARSRSQEPSSDVDKVEKLDEVGKKTALPGQESPGRAHGGLGNFGSFIQRIVIDTLVFFSMMFSLILITTPLSKTMQERVLNIFLLILLGASIGNIISIIRRIKGRPGFVLRVVGCIVACIVTETVLTSSGAPSGVGFMMILLGVGVDGIISVSRRISARRGK